MDLTQDALKPRGISVDTDGFDTSMAHQRAEARKAWAGSGDAATEEVWFAIREELGATDFLGYATERAEGQVLALVAGGHRVDAVKAGGEAAIVVNQSPFYGEAGGQMGDSGIIAGGHGARATVTDSQKRLGDLIVHMARIEAGTLKVGDEVVLEVDGRRRSNLRAHHSATHLLHEALRRELGAHVTQKGSLVAPDRLRFDISHPKSLTGDELSGVETAVNERIRGNSEVGTRLMAPEEAIEAGAMALFGEKYGDEVRVVTMGDEDGITYSVELCGGTHVRRTGDIGLFKIVGEGAVSAGVRRIEAVAGRAAEAHVASRDGALREAADLLRSTPEDLPTRLGALLEERRRLEREVSDLRKKLATGDGANAGPAVKEIRGIRFAPRLLDGIPPRT